MKKTATKKEGAVYASNCIQHLNISFQMFAELKFNFDKFLRNVSFDKRNCTLYSPILYLINTYNFFRV
jgi:hypothetical protein